MPRTLSRAYQAMPGAHALQDSVEDEIRTLPRFWWTEGALHELTFAVAGVTNLAHKLGGAHRGFVVVSLSAAAGVAPVVWERNAGLSSGLTKTHIRLEANAACTVQVWVWR